jgi:hypothetical protein
MNASQQNRIVALLLALRFDARLDRELLPIVNRELAALPGADVARAASSPINFSEPPPAPGQVSPPLEPPENGGCVPGAPTALMKDVEPPTEYIPESHESST